MNLRRLMRTSSFRLTVLYAVVTGASFLVLFAVTVWSSTRHMQQQLDASVASEIREIHAGSPTGDALRKTVEAATHGPDDFYYLLLGPDGTKIAGDLPPMKPFAGVREWIQTPPGSDPVPTEVRGRGQTTADGGFLFVGADAHPVHELRESVSRAFLWGVGAATLLVLAGGALMSASVLRRIEEVSLTSREIVNGDLDRRIPLNGSGDEFDHLAGSLNGMLDRIALLMDGLTQVSTDIAHDLRTPLTRLRQRLELTQKRNLDAAALKEALEVAVSELDAILQTFGALLRIAQIESGTRKANFQTVDLSGLLRTVAEIYQPAIEDKLQLLRVDIDDNLFVRGDQELLTQLYVNLVENALRHCGPDTMIIVAARRAASGIETLIADDGPGIPADQRSKVLHRFYRLDNSRSAPGNGLGLSLAQAVAVLHDTRLELEDNAPGLRVVIRFPPNPSGPVRDHAPR